MSVYLHVNISFFSVLSVSIYTGSCRHISLYCVCLRLLKKRNRKAEMSLVMRKPDFCTCENKDADQRCGNHTDDQGLCSRYMDSTIPLLLDSKKLHASSHLLWFNSPVYVGHGRKPANRFSHNEAQIIIHVLI